MLIRGSSESSAETTLQISDNRITRSNRDRLSPKLPVRITLINHPMPARATPIALAATECGAEMTYIPSPARTICCPSFTSGDSEFAVGNACVDTLYLRMLAYRAAICRTCKWSFAKRLSRNGIVPPVLRLSRQTVLMIPKIPDGFR